MKGWFTTPTRKYTRERSTGQAGDHSVQAGDDGLARPTSRVIPSLLRYLQTTQLVLDMGRKGVPHGHRLFVGDGCENVLEAAHGFTQPCAVRSPMIRVSPCAFIARQPSVPPMRRPKSSVRLP